MHLDGPSRCLIQMLHLGVVRFFISFMHVDESSECSYVHFFNLYLHLGGLVNKMTKIYFFMFRRKNIIFMFRQKNSIFTVLAENVFLTKKCVLRV